MSKKFALPSFDGFLLSLRPDPKEPPAQRAKELAARLLPNGTQWRATALSQDGHEVELSPPKKGALHVSDAFSLSYMLAKQPGVLAAEPSFEDLPGLEPPHEKDPIVKAARALMSPPRPETNDYDWSVERIKARQVWAATQGEGVLVGHPDTGYTQHPEIWETPNNRILFTRGHDFVEPDDDPIDELRGDPLTLRFPGHGTSTASVLMSSPIPPGVRGVTGVAPRASLIPMRVSDSVIHLSMKRLTRGIYHAIKEGCHVLSMSLGGPIPSDALHRAILRAVRQGMILVSAAGNFWPWVVYPARYDEVIAVAASNRDDQMWRFSAMGPDVDITAPGEDVYVAKVLPKTPPVFQVEQSSGTSYATAAVAGAAALWLSRFGREPLLARYGAHNLAAVFRAYLVKHGARTPDGWDQNNCGAGILDVEALLSVSPLSLERAVPELGRSPKSRSWTTLVPAVPEEAVREVATRVLASAAQPFEQEMFFHIATNPALRKFFRKEAQKLGPQDPTSPKKPKSLQEMLELFDDPIEEISPELRLALGALP